MTTQSSSTGPPRETETPDRGGLGRPRISALGIFLFVVGLGTLILIIRTESRKLEIVQQAITRKERIIVGLARRWGVTDEEINRMVATPTPWEDQDEEHQ